MAGISVFVESFSEGESSRRPIGKFDDPNAALTAAAARVDAELIGLFQPGQSAKELFDLWRILGEDVYLVPDDAQPPFSASDFARLRCLTHTGDSSRPVVYEVVCTDRINTAAGFSSPPKQWTFWVRAPETYPGAEHLIERATAARYGEMSHQTMLSDGSTYTLLHLEWRPLTAEESNGPAPAVVYAVQPDGAFHRLT